jgi:hypothetical protein
MASHPDTAARNKAARQGRKRFTSVRVCKQNADHHERFTKGLRCAQCATMRNAKRLATHKAKPKPVIKKIVVEKIVAAVAVAVVEAKPVSISQKERERGARKREDKKLPLLGGDVDNEKNLSRLRRSTTKFLIALHQEALASRRLSP